jgi:hypothetical protein
MYRFSLLLVLALVIGGGPRIAHAAVPGADGPDVSAPVVTMIVGRVEIRPAGDADWKPVAAGSRLSSGDAIRTARRAKAEITHPTGVIRLFEHTVLRLPTEPRGGLEVVRRPELLVGRALFDVVPHRLAGLLSTVGARLQNVFEVATPYVVSGVKGTRFAVIEEGSRSVVAVYSGIVATTNEAGASRDSALLTVGKLATYENGRLTGVSAFRLQDDWSAWARPGVHGPRAPAGATGSSAPARESRLDGNSNETAPPPTGVPTQVTVIQTPTGGSTSPTTGGTTSPTTGGTTDTSSGGTTSPTTGGTTDTTTGGTTSPTTGDDTTTSTLPTVTVPSVTLSAPLSDTPSLTTPSVTLSAPLNINPANGNIR